MKKIHVVLVREWDQQMSGSGCCGRIEGDMTTCQGKSMFPERRKVMERMGDIYRELYERFPEQVEVEVIDPRNLIAYTSVMIREQRNGKAGLWKKIKQFTKGVSYSAIFVNGELTFSGKVPLPEEVVAELEKINHNHMQ